MPLTKTWQPQHSDQLSWISRQPGSRVPDPDDLTALESPIHEHAHIMSVNRQLKINNNITVTNIQAECMKTCTSFSITTSLLQVVL